MFTVINKPREIIYQCVILQSYVGLQESFFAAAICAYRICSYSRINSAGWQVQNWSFGSSILALRILGVETVVETYETRIKRGCKIKINIAWNLRGSISNTSAQDSVNFNVRSQYLELSVPLLTSCMIFAKFGLALLQPVLYHAYFRIKYNIENGQCKCCRIIYFRIDNLLQSTSANWSVAYCCLKVFMIVHDKTITRPSFWSETQRCFLPWFLLPSSTRTKPF